MKKNIILSAMLAMLAMTSCNQNAPESTQPPAGTTAPADSTQQDGTTIKVNDQGMSVESKDGSKETNVNVSKDSASIEISDPK